MLSMLLVNDFLNDYLLTPERIIGLSLIILGVALALVAKRLTRVIKRQTVVEKGDKTFVTILTVALVLILVGMIVCIL